MKGQYTLDADPLLLAKRCEQLELAVDTLAGCMVDLVDSVRIIADACDKALCEDRPLQARAIAEQHERLTHVRDRAHAASVAMGRSY